MKLLFQVVAFVAVLAALVWAKKTYLDKPKVTEQVTTAPTSASVPRTTSAVAQPESRPQTATLQDENNAIANLLNKFAGPKKAVCLCHTELIAREPAPDKPNPIFWIR